MRATFIRPRILTLVTTLQCTAACDHCCFACSPKVTSRIPRERLSALIDEALAIPSISFVSFVGGECFLLGTELDEHFAHCKANGLDVGTTTNAYWAVNEKAARTRIESAVEHGLGTIYISTGEMHAKYVPVNRIIHAAQAACASGIETTVTIERFNGSTFDPRWVTDDPVLAELCDTGRLTIFERDWLPNADGAGVAHLTHDAARSLFAPGAKHRGCTVVLDDLTVNPKLDLLACCGYPVESIPELAIGSVRSMTLLEAFQEAPEDIIKLWLHAAGPERMLLTVKSEVPSYRLPEEAVHPCQVCLHLHRDPIAMQVLNDVAPRYADTLTKMFDALSTLRFSEKSALP